MPPPPSPSRIDRDVDMPNKSQFDKAEFERVLHLHDGVLNRVAEHYEVHRRSVDRWIQKYDLYDMVHKARQPLLGEAKRLLRTYMTNADARFIIAHYDKQPEWEPDEAMPGLDDLDHL